ncbi:MAG TPA: lysophospholipid acyltransferase family protein [Novimethylophilus sp.]|uniref:lysophospholipid acyltransferase family protein n=1 Tax=Novimethylophilus sp. TaxID=2137426 RepID=UPI002F3E1E7D
MLTWLLRQFARLPLAFIHLIGSIAGWGLYLGSPKTANRMRNNLRASGLCPGGAMYRRILRRSIAETGKGLLETFAIWFRPHAQVLQWVRECRGWEHVDAALTAGRGIIFLTPHLGCFEITSLYYASLHPISVLYRPPRKAWLAPLIHAGRRRGQITLAPTNLKGVRGLLQGLRRSEAIGILPDQVPSVGEGEWAKFFGRPAYTMTLVNKLASSTGATVLMAFGERLPAGKGYIIHISPLDICATAADLNAAIEALVRRCPEQYLWSYPRYKVPRGAPKPPVN